MTDVAGKEIFGHEDREVPGPKCFGHEDREVLGPRRFGHRKSSSYSHAIPSIGIGMALDF